MKKMNIKKILTIAFVGVFSLGLCSIPLFKTNNVSANNFDFNDTLTYSYMHDVDVIYNYSYSDNFFDYNSSSSSKISSSGVFNYDGSTNIDGSANGIPNYRTLDYLSFYDGYDTHSTKHIDLVGYGYTLNSNNIEESIYFNINDNLDFTSSTISFNNLISIGNFYSFFNSIKLTSSFDIDFCDIVFTYFSEFDGYDIQKQLIVPVFQGDDGYFYLENFSDLMTSEWYDKFSYGNINLFYYKNVSFTFNRLNSFSCKTYNTSNGFINGSYYNSVLNDYKSRVYRYFYLDGFEDGERVGFEDGERAGFEDGVEKGYKDGVEDGYDNAMKDINPFDVIINTVESFLNLEIFPDFHIYYLFMISIGVMTVGLVMKLLLGG